MKTFETRQYGSQFPGRFLGSYGRARVLAASLLVGACVAGVPSLSLAAKGDCSQPANDGTSPLASDCVYVLRAATGLVPCALCVCDVDGSVLISAGDALQCLRLSVGQAVPLNCPACAVTTTTTTTTKPPGSTSSTTTSSTSSTTSTIPVACDTNAACASLGAPFRCNTNTGQCEKPCTRNIDCKDYFECNAQGYCVPPLLLY